MLTSICKWSTESQQNWKSVGIKIWQLDRTGVKNEIRGGFVKSQFLNSFQGFLWFGVSSYKFTEPHLPQVLSANCGWAVTFFLSLLTHRNTAIFYIYVYGQVCRTTLIGQSINFTYISHVTIFMPLSLELTKWSSIHTYPIHPS